MVWLRAMCLALLLVLWSPAAARPAAQSAEDAIRATVARWYEELTKKDKGRSWDIVAPGFIDASPPYHYRDTGSRAGGPRIHDSLAATAALFRYDIDRMRIDASFARVDVWERGYFYAWAAGKTYERAAATTFVLERREEDGRWLILAHQSASLGIPPHKVTDPMPDLSGATGREGAARPPR